MTVGQTAVASPLKGRFLAANASQPGSRSTLTIMRGWPARATLPATRRIGFEVCPTDAARMDRPGELYPGGPGGATRGSRRTPHGRLHRGVHVGGRLLCPARPRQRAHQPANGRVHLGVRPVIEDQNSYPLDCACASRRRQLRPEQNVECADLQAA
jgi:hypothetical protein